MIVRDGRLLTSAGIHVNGAIAVFLWTHEDATAAVPMIAESLGVQTHALDLEEVGDPWKAMRRAAGEGICGFQPLMNADRHDRFTFMTRVEEAGHILGVQAQLWTEYIGTPKKAEYMAFPRLPALAEIAWTQPAQKDYKDFVERLAKHLERLKALDVNYRGLD